MGKDKVLKMAEPNFGKLLELKELGFDLSDIQKTNHAYVVATQDADKMMKLTKIILKEQPTLEVLKEIPFPQIKQVVYDFLAECGLLIQ